MSEQNETIGPITLREAHRIDTRLNEVLSGEVKHYQTLSVFSDEDTETWLQQATAACTQDFDKHFALLTARAEIRDLIQHANHVEGINQLISTRKVNLACLALYKHAKSLYDCEVLHVTPQILAEKRKARRTRASEGGSMFETSSSDKINVLCITQERLTTIEEVIQTLTRAIDKIHDDLARLNAIATVQLSATTHAVLVKYKII